MALEMELGVKYRNLGRRNGELHSSGVVFLNPSKPDWVQRATLAHEMGHWFYSHDWTRAHNNEADERQADMFAARVLISPTEYALAEAICEHPSAIARELAISTDLVTIWQDWLHRQRIPA